jgi:hypothetical protein
MVQWTISSDERRELERAAEPGISPGDKLHPPASFPRDQRGSE